MVEYAERRVNSHLSRFIELAEMLEARSIDERRLGEIESVDNAFPELEYAAWL